MFVDLDVLAVGPVVMDVAKNYDRYWASPSAYPFDQLVSNVSRRKLAWAAERASRLGSSTAASAFLRTIDSFPLVEDLLAGQMQIEWAATHMVSDDPAKGLRRVADDVLLWERLRRSLGAPVRELRLISAYFVPKAAGMESLLKLTKQGVQLSVLTNSLEATDVAAVHAGYAKRRKTLLRAGVSLYELKRSWFIPREKRRGLSGGSGSASSLHAKTFSVDGERVFIGSFNFDPRSAHLNTEMGFIIERNLDRRRGNDSKLP